MALGPRVVEIASTLYQMNCGVPKVRAAVDVAGFGPECGR